MIFHSHANNTHFHKKGCPLDLILKLRVFATRIWPICHSTNYRERDQALSENISGIVGVASRQFTSEKISDYN